MIPILFSATTKPDEARAFYTEVMGFTLTEDSPFSLAFDAAGTMLRVQKVPEFAPLPFTLIGWQVDDIAARVDALRSRGAVFERFD
ncbi:MAG: VOC family protein, partial [Pseudomonadota bacterium]